MGLFDIASGLLCHSASPGQQGTLLESVVGMLNHPDVGGVAGLAEKFNAGGLGHIMQGWVGNGANPPISAAQLQQVLGSEQVKAFAARTGLPLDQATQHLTELLPMVVSHLTPNGAVPQGGIEASVVSALKARIFGN